MVEVIVLVVVLDGWKINLINVSVVDLNSSADTEFLLFTRILSSIIGKQSMFCWDILNSNDS